MPEISLLGSCQTEVYFVLIFKKILKISQRPGLQVKTGFRPLESVIDIEVDNFQKSW